MAVILLAGTHGTDDPTRASIPFHMAVGAIEAGHQPQIVLMGDASYVIQEGVVQHIQGVGMPALSELLQTVRRHEVPIYV
ncbi:MAG TPA: DsrE family protein [Chloroflexota bacterium]